MDDQQRPADYPVTDDGLSMLHTELGRLLHLTYEHRLAYDRLLAETRRLQEATRASQREAEVRDAFERADAELASLNTNLLTPSDLLRVIRRQHALLQRVRPRLDATVATNEGASAQPQQAVRAQSIQAMGSQTDRTGQTNSVRRAARSK